jgi:hypothetical protein
LQAAEFEARHYRDLHDACTIQSFNMLRDQYYQYHQETYAFIIAGIT